MNYDNMVCIVIKSIQVAALTRKRNVKIGSAIHHNGRPPHLRTSTMIVCVPTEKGRPLETAYAELTHTETTGDGDQEDDGKCILNKHKPNQCTPLPKKKVLRIVDPFQGNKSRDKSNILRISYYASLYSILIKIIAK